MRRSYLPLSLFCLLSLVACDGTDSGQTPPHDAGGSDAATSDAGGSDAGVSDAATSDADLSDADLSDADVSDAAVDGSSGVDASAGLDASIGDGSVMDAASGGCGDGVLDAGEQCDDGNTSPGDGCSAACLAESPWEIEPNDSLATATPLWPGTTSWNASIEPVGDHDWFEITLTVAGALALTTHDVGAPASCSTDTVLHLVDASGVQIAQDDDGGPGSCSAITPTLYPAAASLPAGTYFAWVQRYQDSQTIANYALDVSVH